MTNTPERPGILNEPDLIEECATAIRNVDWSAFNYEEKAMEVINVLRKRGLLTEQGLALIHANDSDYASCPSCSGTGDQGANPSYGVCEDCDGSGKVYSPQPNKDKHDGERE